MKLRRVASMQFVLDRMASGWKLASRRLPHDVTVVDYRQGAVDSVPAFSVLVYEPVLGARPVRVRGSTLRRMRERGLIYASCAYDGNVRHFRLPPSVQEQCDAGVRLRHLRGADPIEVEILERASLEPGPEDEPEEIAA